MPEGAPTQGAKHERAPGRLVIWRFSDGKAGHDNQSLGLVEAIANEVECEHHSLAVLGAPTALMCLVTGRAAAFRSRPDPDLILGAGHATHLSMLAARRTRGGRTIVLMTPTLPTGLFDLCLIPEHDRPRNKDNVIHTRGALNRVQSRTDKNALCGLILLGGPSPQFAFDELRVLAQIKTVLKEDQGVLWTATTSRRTPPGLTESLRTLGAPNLDVVTAEETSPDWLPDMLGQASRVWVTEDSASMVYEALSSGAAVGLLSLEVRRSGRVSRGIEQLVTEGQVTRFDDWLEGASLTAPAAPLDEAKRCARLILDRLPGLVSRG